MTRLAAIFLSIFYAPIGFYAIYKALDIGMTAPTVDEADNIFWVGIGLISLIIVGMSVFYLKRTARPAAPAPAPADES